MLSLELFFIIFCVVIVVAGLLWYRNRRTSTGGQHSNEIETSLVSFSLAKPMLELEIEHARRLEYKLGILVIQELDPAESKMDSTTEESNAHGENGGMETKLDVVLRNTSRLRETLRMIDIVAYDEERQLVVIMLPRVDNGQSDHTTNIVQRLRRQLGPGAGNGVQIGCAEFPGDGLLLDDLISCALSKLEVSESVERINPKA